MTECTNNEMQGIPPFPENGEPVAVLGKVRTSP